MTNQEDLKLELEQILSAIEFDPKISSADEKNNQFTPYILPLEDVGDRYLTVLKFGEKVVHQRLAFSYESKGSTAYHHFKGFDLKKADTPADDRIYLPLAKTEYKMQIGINNKGKFTPHDGSPFHLLGIRGMEEPFPLAYVQETSDGISCRGLYLSKDKVVTSFDFNTLDKLPLQHFLWRAKHQKIKESLRKQTVDVDFSNPQAIITYLDRFIVGQDVAKEMVAVSFSNYTLRRATEDEDIPISHMLLIGPSGVGKTTMMRLLAKAAGIPSVSTKLVGKCAEGFRGQRLSPLFKEFVRESKEEAPYGVMFLDELDKLARDTNYYGERLMNEVIGYIDETVVHDWGDNEKDKFQMNTRNILFIAAGAFIGLPGEKSLVQIVRERSMDDAKISRNAVPADDLLAYVEPIDLIIYGVKSELVGRLSTIVSFHPLNDEERRLILTGSELSPLSGYKKVLKARGFELNTGSNLAELIAASCAKETNARALKSACHKLFYPILLDPQKFAAGNKVITLDDMTVRRLLKNSSLRR